MLSLCDMKHIAVCMSHRYDLWPLTLSEYKKYARCDGYMASWSGEIIISSNWNEASGFWELTTERAESKLIINEREPWCKDDARNPSHLLFSVWVGDPLSSGCRIRFCRSIADNDDPIPARRIQMFVVQNIQRR